MNLQDVTTNESPKLRDLVPSRIEKLPLSQPQRLLYGSLSHFRLSGYSSKNTVFFMAFLSDLIEKAEDLEEENLESEELQ